MFENLNLNSRDIKILIHCIYYKRKNNTNNCYERTLNKKIDNHFNPVNNCCRTPKSQEIIILLILHINGNIL